MSTNKRDLTIVIPALHGETSIPSLVQAINITALELGITSQIVALSRTPEEEAPAENTTFLKQDSYGSALIAGFKEARGRYIITLDPDHQDPQRLIRSLWENRDRAEIVIASRYVEGASPKITLARRFFSRALNSVFRRALSLRVRDISSGSRLYNARALQGMTLENRDYDVLQEILVKAYCEGWQVVEIPFDYAPVRDSRTYSRLISVGMAYLRTLNNLYRLRNSILCADYDARAYDSIVPPQRYWQRQRYRHITQLVQGEGAVLDVGAGSSNIIGALAQGSVAVDILIRKLRFARRFGTTLVHGSGFSLPFPDESFPCVLCSQVIEHVPKESPILDELCRTLKPGGALVLGTPDYANWEWRFIEWVYERVLPSAYADEHISHYTLQELTGIFTEKGYVVEDTRYILRGELILKLRKPG